jgi:nitrate/TMAO reductase-like tetraheme cytochrome c subunit
MPGALRRRYVATLLLCAAATTAGAQLSPGELAAPHAHLEGSSHCLDCHSAEKGVARTACLACHEPLRERIDAGRGLHAAPEMAACERCHIEHHGRAFELVWWGDSGREAFEHATTGYELAGAHQSLDCRACHRADLVRDPSLASTGKDLDRTFLGLGQACVDCHEDEHRSQFADRECTQCHDSHQWQPAAGFDHDQTRFSLRGAHRPLRCESCHTRVDVPVTGTQAAGNNADSFVEYRGLDTTCAGCHSDPHRGRLGPSCSDCHDENTWRGSPRSGFEHSLTRFPLDGLHREVGCDDCHSDRLSSELPGFERCATCHDDPHRGELAARPDGGACESCHDVRGFLPALFDVQDHQQTAYALQGAHLAVGCAECHRREVAESAATAPGVAFSFHPAASTCDDCHATPHGASETVAAQGCSACHDTESWQAAPFDHERTGFSLAGAHGELGCASCHQPTADAAAPLTALADACSDCHDDAHVGQFDGPPQNADCTLCHLATSWQDVAAFDHQAVYALEGAHARASCELCHPRETSAGRSFVRYRPVGRDCRDCHAGSDAAPARR